MDTHMHVCCQRVKPPWKQHSANETCPALTDYMSVTCTGGKKRQTQTLLLSQGETYPKTLLR